MHVSDVRAEANQHVADHMVAQDEDAPGFDLGRQVPVADVPGKFGQFLCRMARYFHQRLFRRDHFDQPAILEFEHVAMFELCRLGKIHHDDILMHQLQPPASQVALLVVEYDKVERHARPAPVPEMPASLEHP
jgi:hypothetical protein